MSVTQEADAPISVLTVASTELTVMRLKDRKLVLSPLMPLELSLFFSPLYTHKAAERNKSGWILERIRIVFFFFGGKTNTHTHDIKIRDC